MISARTYDMKEFSWCILSSRRAGTDVSKENVPWGVD